MASELVFNPIRLLQIAPFASSTGTLAHATVELIANSGLLIPRIRAESDSLLPTWYDHMFGKGVWSVLALNATTITTSAATIYLNSERNDLQTTAFYWIGLLGAISHLAFVPFVAGPVQRIVNYQTERKRGDVLDTPSRQMERWVAVHKVRMLVADLPAWIAFAVAVMTL